MDKWIEKKENGKWVVSNGINNSEEFETKREAQAFKKDCDNDLELN